MENCGGLLPPFEVPGLVPFLLLVHLISLSMLFACALIMHRHVEIGHPVFACIFQEVVVLCICETVEIAMLVTNIWFRLEWLAIRYLHVARVALQIHPTTWVIVTSLRYVMSY